MKFAAIFISPQRHDNDVRKCSFCPWVGIEAHTYANHMNNHFRNKPYKCNKCDEKFIAQNSLNKHFEALHEKDPEKYSCDTCDYKTYSSGTLYNHKKKCF
jgi:hypothetical protein